MKRVILFLFSAVIVEGLSAYPSALLSVPSPAKLTMADCFRAMPGDLFPYITTNNRLDMLDFIDSKMEARVNDGFGEDIHLDTISVDYLSLSLGRSVGCQMRLLPLSQSQNDIDSCMTIIIVVTTFWADSIADSSVRFFTAQWQPLDVRRFLPPRPQMFCRLTLSPSSYDINIDEYSVYIDNTDDTQKLKTRKTSRIIKWNGKIFNKY